MKNTSLVIASVTALIGLIVAFENIVLPSQGLRILFWTTNTSLFFPLLLIFILGMVSGYFFALTKYTQNHQDDIDI